MARLDVLRFHLKHAYRSIIFFFLFIFQYEEPTLVYYLADSFDHSIRHRLVLCNMVHLRLSAHHLCASAKCTYKMYIFNFEIHFFSNFSLFLKKKLGLEWCSIASCAASTLLCTIDAGMPLFNLINLHKHIFFRYEWLKQHILNDFYNKL